MATVMWGYGWGWVSMLVGGVTTVLFWALIIVGIVVLVRYFANGRGREQSGSTRGRSHAEEILAERFARGEIDADEYQRRLELLRAHR